MQHEHHDGEARPAQRMTGFPPSEDGLVSLATWQDAENVHWSFQHMREIIPTHAIPAERHRLPPLEEAPDPTALQAPVTLLDGSTSTAGDVFAETFTDALLVL